MPDDKVYYLYLLQCSDGSYYTGIARDLEQRLKQHNGLVKGGASYTKTRRPVVLKYFEKFATRSQALKREAEIKKLNHDKKTSLVKSL